MRRRPRRRPAAGPVVPVVPVASVVRPARVALLAVAVALAACAPAAPSSASAAPGAAATTRPEFAWSRAAIRLPDDVVQVAPGTSPDIQCSPCHAVQASLMQGVAATPDGLLAVGVQLPPAEAVAYRSTDGGRTWGPEPGFTAAEDTAADAAAAGTDGRAVVVGRHGDAAAAWVRGADGTWTAVALPAEPGSEGSASPDARAEALAVAAWRDGFVAVGRRDAAGGVAGAWASADGTTWAAVPGGPAWTGAAAYGLAAAPDLLVAVGETVPRDGSGSGAAGSAAVDGVAWVSEDGAAWTRVASPALARAHVRAVAWTGSGFVAVGYAAADDCAIAWTSPDGRAWTASPSSPALEQRGRPIRMLGVAAAADGSLVAVGWQSDAGNGSGTIWTSPDGIGWTRLPDQVAVSGGSLAGVAVTAAGPVAVGTSGYPDNDQASAWYPGP